MISLEFFYSYIKSIGFIFLWKDDTYEVYFYGKYRIYIWYPEPQYYYALETGETVTNQPIDNLKPINDLFKKELRAIKLKEITVR